MTDDDFKGYPETLAERVSSREGRADKWKPRDALINLLRDIDSKKVDIDHLVIFYRLRPADPGVVNVQYVNAGGDPHTTFGMVHMGLHKMLHPQQT